MADAATWKKHVAAWRARGETAAAYCEQLTSSSSTCPARPRPRSASSSAASAVTSRPTPRCGGFLHIGIVVHGGGEWATLPSGEAAGYQMADHRAEARELI